MLRFSGAGVSDVGRVRPHNEDSGVRRPLRRGRRRRRRWRGGRRDRLGHRGLRRQRRRAEPARAASGAGARRRRTPPRRTASGWASSATSTGSAWPPRSRWSSTDGRTVALGHVGDSRGYLLPRRRAAPDHQGPHLRPAPRRHRSADARGPGRAPVAQRGAALGRRRPRGRRPRRRPARHARSATGCCWPATGSPTWCPTTSDRRRARRGGGRRRGGHADPAGPRRRRPRQHHRASSSTSSTGPPVVGDGRLLGALADPWNVVDPASASAVPRVVLTAQLRATTLRRPSGTLPT